MRGTNQRGENISICSSVYIQKLMQGNVRLQGLLRRLRVKTDTYEFFLSENRPLRKAVSKFVPIPSSKQERTRVCPICLSSSGGLEKDHSGEWRAEIPTHQPFSTYMLMLFLTWADHFFISLSRKLEGAVVCGEVDKCLLMKNKDHLRLNFNCVLQSQNKNCIKIYLWQQSLLAKYRLYCQQV